MHSHERLPVPVTPALATDIWSGGLQLNMNSCVMKQTNFRDAAKFKAFHLSMHALTVSTTVTTATGRPLCAFVKTLFMG